MVAVLRVLPKEHFTLCHFTFCFFLIMSVSSATSRAVATRQWKYDVFFNFRSGDTRWGFLGHLREALHREKLVTFVDEDITRGKEISPALVKAIEDSNVALAIFSKDYASSPWCLEELVKIIECYQFRGQIVIPIFFGVNSSVVLNQTGIYAKAFADHQKDPNNARRVPVWKGAMTKAAQLAGKSAQKARSEAELVKEIVNDILKAMGRTSNGMDNTVETRLGLPKSLSVNNKLVSSQGNKEREKENGVEAQCCQFGYQVCLNPFYVQFVHRGSKFCSVQ